MNDFTSAHLLRGEWVESHELEAETGLTFSQLLKSPFLEFNRTVEWNKPPLNGQSIHCYFRLKEPQE